MNPSWMKAFVITPVITLIVSYVGYNVFGFTLNAYVISGLPTGLVSAMIYYHLIPKYKFVISVFTYTALYLIDLYAPATEAAGELQEVSHIHDIVFTIAAGIGILISLSINRRISNKLI